MHKLLIIIKIFSWIQLDSNILRIKADLASRAANGASSDKSSKTEIECTSEADVPNIDGAGISNNNSNGHDLVDPSIVSESTTNTMKKSVAVSDHSKDKRGELSNSNGNHHTASEAAAALSTGSITEAIPSKVINSTALDDGSFPMLSSQTAVSDVRINYPCSAQTETENTRDSEGYLDLCTSLDHRQIKSSESSNSVTTLPMQTTL